MDNNKIPPLPLLRSYLFQNKCFALQYFRGLVENAVLVKNWLFTNWCSTGSAALLLWTANKVLHHQASFVITGFLGSVSYWKIDIKYKWNAKLILGVICEESLWILGLIVHSVLIPVVHFYCCVFQSVLTAHVREKTINFSVN